MRRFAGLARMPALVIFTALVVLSVARVSAQESGSPMILPVDPAPLVVETDAGAKSFAVEIADGLKVRVQRGLISSVMAKTEPAKGDEKSGGKGKEVVASKGVSGFLGGLFGGGKGT